MGATKAISLGQFAAVIVATAEGHPLAAVLDIEGHSLEAWRAAEELWRRAIASDAAVATALGSEVERAEDHLTRRVEPVDYDVAAWLSFYRAYSAVHDKATFLNERSLVAADVGRLERLWARRGAEDSTLQRRVADLAMQSLPDCGPLRVEGGHLKRSLVSTAPESGQASPASDGAELDLLQYAAISAEIAAAPAARIDILARAGIDATTAWDSAWKKRLAADDSLAKDYRSLVSHYARRFSGGRANGDIPRAAALSPNVMPAKAEPSHSSIQPAPATLMSGRAALRATVRAADAPQETSAFEAPPRTQASARATIAASNLPSGPALPFVRVPGLPGVRQATHSDSGAIEPALLSLEQHASLCVELTVTPERTHEILVRYGLTPELKARADAYWRERAKAEPAVESAWASAYETYQTWFVAHAR